MYHLLSLSELNSPRANTPKNLQPALTPGENKPTFQFRTPKPTGQGALPRLSLLTPKTPYQQEFIYP